MSGQGKEKIAILVAGMHRSGTSVLARVLNISGCDLPATLLEANPTNEAGHWESRKIVFLNNEILASAGSSWRDWNPLNPQWYASPVAGRFRRRAQEALVSEFGDSAFFVLKDPRICRLLPFWIEAVRAYGAEPMIVSPIRNPLDVAASLEKRDGIVPSIGHLLWLRHVLDAEKDTRGMKRAWLLYNAFLSEPYAMVDAIGDALGVSWPRSTSVDAQIELDEFVCPSIRHHWSSDAQLLEDPRLSHWIKSTFDIFNRWCGRDVHDEDVEELDRIRSVFDAALPAFSYALASSDRALAERDGQIGELRQALVARDARVEELDRAVVERDGQIGELRQTLAARDARVEELDRAVVERDGQIGELRQTLAARDARVEELDRAVVERDGQIGELRQTLAARDARVEELDRAVVERDGQIGELRQTLAARDARVEELDRAVVERDGQIGELHQALAVRDARVENLYNSRSWRATAILRLPRRLWQIYRSSPQADGFSHIHRLMRIVGRSRLPRKMIDLSFSILRRHPVLIPIARRMSRLLPFWMDAELRSYHYRWKIASASSLDLPKKKTQVENSGENQGIQKALEPYAKRGQLTKGWYGGRALRPEETCLAKAPPPQPIVELGEKGYRNGSHMIDTGYLSEQEPDEGIPPYMRHAPLDEYRDFLAERHPPDSVVEMFDCGGFTVVTPFHRHLDFFAHTAASVDRLVFGEEAIEADLEWVVVNDDPAISDDELSERIPKRLLSAVRQIRPDGEGGIVEALNSGIRHGRYRWFLFLDCDDEIEPNTLVVLDHYRRQFPRCRYMSSSMIDIDEQGSVLRFRGNEHPVDRLLDIGMLAGHLKAIRRDLFDDIGFFDQRFDFCQDYEFALRTSVHEPILKIPEPLYRYRWHERTQSVSRADRQKVVHQRIQREYLRRFLSIRVRVRPDSEIAERKTVIHSVSPSRTPLRGAVIIRTQNKRQEMLPEAVESVSAQTPALTPVVVVHGSDDDLRSVKSQLSTGDDVVFLHADEYVKPNRRLGYPANVALDYMEDQADRFDFISFLDDDDILYPCFSSIIDEALRWSGADCIYAMSNKRRLWQLAEPGPVPHPASCLIMENFITCNSYGLTTAFLRQSGIRFDEGKRYLDDWDFLLSLWDAGACFRFLPETVSEFRITNDGNTVRKNYPDEYISAVTHVQKKAWNIAIAQEAGLMRFWQDVLDFEWPETRPSNGGLIDLTCGTFMNAEQHRNTQGRKRKGRSPE